MDADSRPTLDSLRKRIEQAVDSGDIETVLSIQKSPDVIQVKAAEAVVKSGEAFKSAKKGTSNPENAFNVVHACLRRLFLLLEVETEVRKTIASAHKARLNRLGRRLDEVETKAADVVTARVLEALDKVDLQKDLAGKVGKLTQQLSAAQSRIAALERKTS